jgi:phosphoglycolate phosphatase-like HAD superfamily hydrolase
MTRTIAAVVFDMDGLLLDTERLSRQAWLAGGQDLGVELPMTALTSIIGRRRPEVEAEFRAAMGESFAVDALYERHAVHYHALLRAATPAQTCANRDVRGAARVGSTSRGFHGRSPRPRWRPAPHTSSRWPELTSRGFRSS